jgi:hypothetical protein
MPEADPDITTGTLIYEVGLLTELEGPVLDALAKSWMESIKAQLTSIPLQGMAFGWIRYMGHEPSGLAVVLTAREWLNHPLLDEKPNRVLTFEVDIMLAGYRPKHVDLLEQGGWLRRLL